MDLNTFLFDSKLIISSLKCELENTGV